MLAQQTQTDSEGCLGVFFLTHEGPNGEYVHLGTQVAIDGLLGFAHDGLVLIEAGVEEQYPRTIEALSSTSTESEDDDQ